MLSHEQKLMAVAKRVTEVGPRVMDVIEAHEIGAFDPTQEDDLTMSVVMSLLTSLIGSVLALRCDTPQMLKEDGALEQLLDAVMNSYKAHRRQLGLEVCTCDKCRGNLPPIAPHLETALKRIQAEAGAEHRRKTEGQSKPGKPDPTSPWSYGV